MGELLVWMRDASDFAFDARAYVDTGPVQERAFRAAGGHWQGREAHVREQPQPGVVVVPVGHHHEPGARTGRAGAGSVRHLHALPRRLSDRGHRRAVVVDTTRCLSYFTIEVRGDMPLAERDEVGAHVFGCDICQDVCPWNASSACSDDASWLPRDGFDGPTVVELWRRPDKELSGLLRRSSMKRTGLTRLRRNLAVALGNTATETSRRALEPDSLDSTVAPSLDDPVVASHVE